MTNDDKMEMLGCIIDIFEDFLDEHNVYIHNKERDEDEGEDCYVHIYGSDYDFLSNQIEQTLVSFDVLKDN